ncbi:MAG: DUF4167 domain-containing protein [Hyphomonas sp.]|jgi:Domain of unknown function (DUF4167)|nr:DUF4167 domain-containing protein [Hyphomonas sp.]
MAMQRKRRRRSGGNNNNNNSPNPNRHYESNGPEVRIRGSAQQILDKYMQYARDAQTSGDRVKAEALFQHAEHYARIVAVFEKQKEEARLEREARDAAKAEERAQRDAERAAQSEADDENPQESGDDAISEASSDSSEDAKPRRRSRKPRDENGVATDETTSDAPEAIEASTEDDEKPKRRRTYNRKKDAAPDAGEEADGVMKTLARGADEVVAEAE